MIPFLKQFALRSRGARYQFGIGVALLAIIPILALAYFFYSRVSIDTLPPWQVFAMIVAVPVVGLSGYMVLRKYPSNILRLRRYMENIVSGEFPERISLPDAEEDILVIEKCMNLMIERLRHKVRVIEAEKQSLTAQLYQAQKMESLGLMAGGVAHDFGNFLQAIMGHAELARRMLPANSTAAVENLAHLESSAKQAADLVNQMLTYAGKGTRHATCLDMSNHVRSLERLLRTAAPRSFVTLTYKLENDLPGIEADPTQITQVVLNLVMNAAEAIGKTNKGEITISTGIETLNINNDSAPSPDGSQSVKHVFVRVADSGPGMTEETKSKIFDPFFTTKPTGRGLGLAVVMGIVAGHKGLIRVVSSPGNGAVFTMFLPVR